MLTIEDKLTVLAEDFDTDYVLEKTLRSIMCSSYFTKKVY